jgi:hypothetical protein
VTTHTATNNTPNSHGRLQQPPTQYTAEITITETGKNTQQAGTPYNQKTITPKSQPKQEKYPIQHLIKIQKKSAKNNRTTTREYSKIYYKKLPRKSNKKMVKSVGVTRRNHITGRRK